MQTITDATGLAWQQIIPEGGTLEDLEVGRLRPVSGRPGLVVGRVAASMTFTVMARRCPHRGSDLATWGEISEATLHCEHLRFTWCAVTGRSHTRVPDIPVFRTLLDNGQLYALLPKEA